MRSVISDYHTVIIFHNVSRPKEQNGITKYLDKQSISRERSFTQFLGERNFKQFLGKRN